MFNQGYPGVKIHSYGGHNPCRSHGRSGQRGRHDF